MVIMVRMVVVMSMVVVVVVVVVVSMMAVQCTPVYSGINIHIRV
jgi:hypothetical protein